MFLVFANAALTICSFFINFFLCSFSFNSFYYLKFSSMVIHKPLKSFFLLDCFISNFHNCIKSSKLIFLPVLKSLYLQFLSYLQLVSKSTGMNKIAYFFFLATIPLFNISFTTDFLNFADALSCGELLCCYYVPFFSCCGYADFSVIPFVQSCFLECLGICSFSS